MKNIPHHIGFIVDGNRRWAKKRGLPTSAGHIKGTISMKKIVIYTHKLRIKIMTIYSFSSENWKRSKKEINYLMKIFEKFIDDNIQEFHQKGIQLRHLGQLHDLPISLQKKITEAVELTKNNTKMILQVALNYGGRDEIKRAIQKIIKEGLKPEQITENLISKKLDTNGLPDPDLVIRTSGEKRLSGFLLWQASYSELYFPKVCWPDFSPKRLDEAIAEFGSRQRRYGGK